MDDPLEKSLLHHKQLGEGKCYRILRCSSRIAVWSYFRHLKVICRTPLPTHGPLLVAANHTNMVLDPAILIATFPHKRPCHFGPWLVPVVGQLLIAGGVLPVDTKTHSNAKLFEHTLDCLGKGGVIALFPEGTSYTAPKHLPFKDGLSWATFEYLMQQQTNETKNDISLPIIPVGITYTTKNKWRSDVVIEYGEPIYVDLNDLDAFQKDPKTSVKNLTQKIAKGVEKGTVNAPDWDTADAASQARCILFGDARGIRLEDYAKVSQCFIDIFHPDVLDNDENNKNKNDGQFIKERKELKSQLLICSKNLKRMKLTALDIQMYENNEITQPQACIRLISTTLQLVLRLPFFLPGLIINSPLYILGRCVNRFEIYTESVAQDKVIFALILAIPIYSTLFYLIWKQLNYSFIGFLVTTIIIPLFAWYHIRLVDKRYDMAKQVIASWRIFIAVTGLDDERKELEEVVKLRKWCSHQIKYLLLHLQQHGNPQAQFLVEYGQPLFQNDDMSS
ncbi:unnamed protein product [Cunninghamella echinulata]